MQFLIVLVLASFAFLSMPHRLGGRSIKDGARRGMAVAFVFAGVSHLTMPESFDEYFPSWVPMVEAIVFATGVIEIAGGLGLLMRRFQARVGLALAAYLLLVFPANVYVAVAGVEQTLPGLVDGQWYAWLRLPLQALYIWWMLQSTQSSVSKMTLPKALGTVAAAR